MYRGYAQLRTAALAPGALDVRIKELIALAIAVTHECDGCIASHAEGAARVPPSPRWPRRWAWPC